MSNKKIKLDRKQGLYLKDTGAKGNGLFCSSDIRKGEVLEVAPSLILNDDATRRVDKTILSNYTFITGSLPKKLREKTGIKNTDDSSVVIMGVAAFCNHDEKPNAEIVWEEAAGVLYYSLQATAAIPKNTEICTSYGKGWFEDRKKSLDLWIGDHKHFQHLKSRHRP